MQREQMDGAIRHIYLLHSFPSYSRSPNSVLHAILANFLVDFSF